MKVIFSGLEGSGKSLKLAMLAPAIVTRNSKWFDKQKALYDAGKQATEPVMRSIASNLRFSEEFSDWAMKEMGVPIIYWDNLSELIELENVDVFIDEVGNYFDSRMWTDLSLDARRWLTQGSKMGIELYGTAQDFAQVDKAFRRLVNHLVHVTKIAGSRRPSATKPPVKRIWGVCSTKELDPQQYDEEKSKFNGSPLSFRFFYIRKQYCDIFDTTQKIKRSKPMPFKHTDRFCELENCGFHKQIHV
jgi:hypothetical protein